MEKPHVSLCSLNMNTQLFQKKYYPDLEQVTTEIFFAVDGEGYSLAFLRHRGSGFDFIILVATFLAIRGHDEDFLRLG